MAKSRRSKACNISNEVRRIVRERDNDRCIFCQSYGSQVAHLVARSQGGLGIPENLVLSCVECHYRMDNSDQRNAYRAIARDYLQSKYPDWDESKLYYKKW